jgi:hypothetical protein
MPPKTDAPLIIDADTVLAFPVAFQLFELVARRGQQIAQIFSIMQIEQLASRRSLDVMWQLPRNPSLKDQFRFSRRKRFYHEAIISRRDTRGQVESQCRLKPQG